MKANNAQSYPKSRNVKDTDTGKEFTLTDTASTWGDKDFHKVFMKPFRKALKGIKDQRLQVVLWLMENMTPFNQVLFTYQKIADGSKTSYQTVIRTIEMLEKHNFLCRTEEGLLVNPNVVFRGRYESRSKVLETYQKAWTKNRLAMPDEKEREKLNLELVEVEDDLKKKLEEVKNLEGKKRLLEKRLAPRRKPGPKKKTKEDKDGTNQISEQEPKPEPKEEDKDGENQTSEPET